MNENNSLETAKEFLYSLKADTADITDSGIEEVNMLRGQSLKTDNFSQMKLPINLVNRLCSKKIDKASLVQKNVIPFILEGNPVSVQSRSGSGKTIAYTVGTLPKIVGDRSVQCLVITPTKVLSRQVSEEMTFFADSLELKVSHPVTWADYVHNTAEIVVGCPGTLLNLIDNFLNVQIIILDEADFLLDPRKMGQETILILKLIPNAQRLYFSATYSPKIKEIINNIEKGNFLAEFRSMMEGRLSYQTKLLLNNLSKQSKLNLPNQFNKKELITFYEAKNDKPEEIKLFHTFVPENEKTNFLLQLYNLLPMSQSIIFVSKRSTVESLKKVFEDDLYQVSFLHGDMNEECKRNFVDEFSQGKTKILITTDIFSRGLDIPLVNAIINYDLPMNKNVGMVDTYIHRIGRSGRFGRKGFVLDFCASDADFQAVKNFSDKLSFENKFFYMADLEIAWKEIESSNFY